MKKKTSFNDYIIVRGAREHNLKNIDVAIPKNKLTIITGPSGSGKSSLALDILFTEGKRRYVESLSSYARQFLGISKRPDVDSIEGLCPAIAIEQRTVGANPRSTVGTITEIYDYLRVLFARVGKPHCPQCLVDIKPESPENITTMVMQNFSTQFATLAAPIAIAKKGEFVAELTELFAAGYNRFLINGTNHRFNSVDEIKKLNLKKTYAHTIDVLIDAVEVTEAEQSRIAEGIEKAFKVAKGMCKIIVGTTEHIYSTSRMCLHCAQSFPELEPRFFSFNSPIGACQTCHGIGTLYEWPWDENDKEFWKTKYPDFFGGYAQEQSCSGCSGKRLNPFALAVTIGEKTIFDIGELSIKDAVTFFNELRLGAADAEIAQEIIKEVTNRIRFLNNVGLSYLSLNRSARTLSGGEGQRIRLATQIGSALSGVLYILDEPSIGLHQRDNDRLIETLKTLRDQGNTVVVVEHDLDTMRSSDYIIDMGPAAGILGGRVTATGTPAEIMADENSLTGAYLSGRRAIAKTGELRKPTGYLTLANARKNNLKDLTVKFPLGVFCGISGVSGSGKSTLIMQELVPTIQRLMATRKKRDLDISDGDIQGVEQLENMVVIDQSPIGRSSRSNPSTYLGIFDEIRRLFAALPASVSAGFKVGRFSFNVPEGRCFDCKGDGTITVSMHFLPEVTMVCKTCDGKRYNRETLAIKYKNKNIADVLDMTALEALEFFAAHTTIAKRLKLLCEVGLDYVKLGQLSTTLSGGEAQRIKLVDELAKRGHKTWYILDEPTTGLHSNDVEKLLVVLNTLVDKGNSILVIEHNLDVLKTVDYLIDLGPDGGDGGGTIVAHGTPDTVAHSKASYTGKYLKEML
jgi:excinuclease ABC subunit A